MDPSPSYDVVVTQLTVVVPDEVAERLVERAVKEHTTPKQLASEAVQSYIGPPVKPGGHRLSFVGLGRSGRSDLSERVEEILRAEFGA